MRRLIGYFLYFFRSFELFEVFENSRIRVVADYASGGLIAGRSASDKILQSEIARESSAADVSNDGRLQNSFEC